MNNTAPIFVETDASDYGIGAVLYQLVDNKKQPIAFMSKALHGAQRNNKNYRFKTIDN